MRCLAVTVPHAFFPAPRAIRKLVTNNKRRHSLILALHAAGDGSGYGDLGKVYGAVKSMHDGLAAGTGWNSEAGACVCVPRPRLLRGSVNAHPLC